MWQSIQRAFVIALMGVVVGVVVNGLRWDGDQFGNLRRLALVPAETVRSASTDNVALEEARRLWETGAAIFLDARPSAQYEEGHIANALSLPAEAFNEVFPHITTFITTDSALIVYCDGEQCELSHEVQRKLRELGFSNVRVLVNGWTTWKGDGLLTAKGAQP